MTNNMDMNKYDRMIRTYGIKETGKLQSSTVYIIGLKRGYAGEICKNLALSGINTIILVGDEKVDCIDMETYCYNGAKEGDSCSTILANNIRELNSSVNININIHGTFLPNSSVVVINKSIEETIVINKMCRLNSCKMVHLLCSGVAGSIFVDCGNNHEVMDTTGENKDTVQVKDIKMDGTIISGEHNLNYGDIITFSNVMGTNINFLNSNFKIIDTNKYNFKIVSCENNNFILPSDFVFINGNVIHIKTPTIFSHTSLDNMKIDDIITLNLDCIIQGKLASLSQYNYTKDLIIEPVTSLMGGFASTEVIKMVCMKYTPINQIFTWSDHSIFNNYTSEESINEEYNLLIKKMSEQNILMVGCGALGCEWLKNCAMLNVSKMDIVDHDHIEHSNLTRQFLFRSSHVGKSKCKTAIEMIQRVKPNMCLTGYENKITAEDNESTYKVFKDKTIVISALDNIVARRYVDMMCFDRTIPLFESGTMGMKGNTQPVIPFLTETYSNMNDAEEIKQFPVCTIKNFPNQIQHTIHWGRDYFEMYCRGPSNCNKWLECPSILDTLPLIEKNQAIDDINYFLKKIPSTMYECMIKARDLFEKLFNHDIIQLLHCFPKDHIIDNTLFWSHGKICPSVLDFSYKNQYMIDFIYSTTNILCSIYNIRDIFNRDDIIHMIKTDPIFTINKYQPKDIKIAANDSELGSIDKNVQESTLHHISIDKNFRLNPQEFEKDDDTNHHISCINSMSNCRASNYNITPISDYEAKGIAGNIIPAVATTTSTIVGLIAIELLKYVNGCNKLENYRSWFINMADNTTIYSEPVPTPNIMIGGTKINGWTKFKHTDNSSLEEFIKKYETMFNVKIFMILYSSNILYSEFTNDDMKQSLYNIILERYNVKCDTNEVILTLISEDTLIELPPIILKLI